MANGSIIAATSVTTIACQVAQRTINTAKFLRQEGYWNLKTLYQKKRSSCIPLAKKYPYLLSSVIPPLWRIMKKLLPQLSSWSLICIDSNNIKRFVFVELHRVSMWLCKNILTSKFSYIYFFPTLPIKLKLRLQIDGRLAIATQLDQSLWLANQKQGAAVRSYVLHSSLAGVMLCCAFYQP